MKKRAAERVLLLAGTAVLLAACGGGSREAKPPQPAADGSLGSYTEPLVCAAGRSTIANPKFPDGDSYEDNAYTRYVREKLNIEIVDEFEANGADYDRQVSLAIASGELPDIMRVGGKDILDELVENDLVADLTEAYDTYASDYIKGIYESYGDRCLGQATYNGKLMALPGTNLDSAPCETYIRSDWLEELELTIDEDGDRCITLEELEMIAQAFLEKDPGHTGKPVGLAFASYLTADDYGGSTYTVNAVGSACSAFPKVWQKDENGQVFYGSIAPETKKLLGILSGWFRDGLLDPQFGTRSWDDITALLTNNQLGIVFGPWHIPDWLLNNVRGMNPQATFQAYAIADENGRVNVTHSNAASGFIVVRKNYSNPEAVIKLANLFFDDIVNNANLAEEAPEVSDYISRGVDGTARPINLEINSATSLLEDYSDIKRCVNGEITMEEVHTAESRGVITAVQSYLKDKEHAEVAEWAPYTSRMEGIELIDRLTRDDNFSWVTPAFWGVTETSNTHGANLAKMEEEMFVAIVTGAKDIDEFDTFVKQWKEQGGDKITAEIQAIVDGEEEP